MPPRGAGSSQQFMQTRAQSGTADATRVSVPEVQHFGRQLSHGARTGGRAASGEVTVERPVRQQPKAQRGKDGVRVGTVIRLGFERPELPSELLARLRIAQVPVSRAIYRADDLAVGNRHQAAFHSGRSAIMDPAQRERDMFPLPARAATDKHQPSRRTA